MADKDIRRDDGSGLKTRVKEVTSGVVQEYVHIANPGDIGGALPTGAATSPKQDEQSTLLGAVNETAPATDTASSGLNGRLQRAAQRITSLIAMVATAANQVLVLAKLASIDTKLTGAANQANNQVTAGSVSAALVIARATRRSVLIRNTDASNSVYIGAGAVTSGNGFLLKAGESVSLTFTEAINCIRATADVVLAYWDEYD